MRESPVIIEQTESRRGTFAGELITGNRMISILWDRRVGRT